MKKQYFYRIGLYMHRHRIQVVTVWTIIILFCIPFLPYIIDPFQSTGFVATDSKSAKTHKMLNEKIDYYYNRFIVLYTSKSLSATSWRFNQNIKDSLKGLKTLKMPYEVFYPNANKRQVSKDKKAAYAVVLFKDNKRISREKFDEIKAAIKQPKRMAMHLGGERAFIENINEQTQKDLNDADKIAAPVGTIVLILVFGSIVAALIPMCLGGGCAFIILTFLYLMAEMFNLSIFTINIALLLGLCLVLDYSLFIVHRFRDELNNEKNGKDISKVVATTIATAGKAVFVSGLSVFISLSALLFFPVNILFSLAVGGLVAVGAAVSMGITLLPALLSFLKGRVNSLSVYKPHKKKRGNAHSISERFWLKLASKVVSRPLFFFFSSIILLGVLAYPFWYAKFGISDYKILPEHSDSRMFYQLYDKHFDVNELSPIQVVVSVKKGKVLYRSNLNRIYNFAKKLKKNKKIEEIKSIVTTEPQLSRYQYYGLYKQPKSRLPSDIKKLLKTTTTDKFTLITVVSKYGTNSAKTIELIKELRDMNAGKGLKLDITGVPVKNLDVMTSIIKYFPYVLVWIIVLTYVVLLFLLKSVVLPFKALIMTSFSLLASYGVLTFVFQDGYLHNLLDFNIQDMLDLSLLIIIFCALFGFSMDYEVFLLTRIHEFYIKTKDNDKSIIFGIVKSSKVITSAALIVIFTCGSFMVADVMLVKAFGLGIAAAIFVDAFIIRTLFVPATMVLLGKWNWYMPKWIGKYLGKGA